nr:hypothetical protein Iba_chr12eCG12160 [Ipomoea batatas]
MVKMGRTRITGVDCAASFVLISPISRSWDIISPMWLQERENLFDAFNARHGLNKRNGDHEKEKGIFDIDSLSISLNVKSSLCFNASPVQLTGTKTAKAKSVMGRNIFSLHNQESAN